MRQLRDRWDQQRAESAAREQNAEQNAAQSPHPSVRKKLKADVRLAKDGGVLAGGGVAAAGTGVGIATYGLLKLTADAVTGIFNQKAPKRIAVAGLLAAFLYGAAQEELGAPSLGDMYKGSKDWAISLITNDVG